MSVTRTPRPTRLGWLPLIAAPVLGVLSVMTVDSWLLLLAGASLGLAIAAILLRPRLADLDVTVDMPVRAELGQPVTSRIVLRNIGRHSTPLTLVTHRVAGLADLTFVVDGLPRGGSAEVVVERTATARGCTEVSHAVLSSAAPLGLVTTEALIELSTPMTVHPTLVPVRLPLLRSTDGEGGVPEPDRSGVDVHGIREWRSGDGARQVHWRSTARRGRLVVLEREAPHGGSLVVLVAGPSGHPYWESLVSVVASLSAAASQRGHVVSLYASQSGIRPVTSGQRLELLDWCAALGAVGLPGEGVVDASLARAGRGGVVHVAASDSGWPPSTPGGPGAPGAPSTWWTMAHSLARRAGVRLEPLPRLERALAPQESAR